jgi:hypothetical protein
MKLPIAASLRPVECQPYRVIGVMIRKIRGNLLEITIAARTACPTSRTSRASTPKAGSEIHPRNQIRAANRLLSSQALFAQLHRVGICGSRQYNARHHVDTTTYDR